MHTQTLPLIVKCYNIKDNTKTFTNHVINSSRLFTNNYFCLVRLQRESNPGQPSNQFEVTSKHTKMNITEVKEKEKKRGGGKPLKNWQPLRWKGVRTAQTHLTWGFKIAESKQTGKSHNRQVQGKKELRRSPRQKLQLWKSDYLIGQLLCTNNPTGGGKTVKNLPNS